MNFKKSLTTSRCDWQPDLPVHRDCLYAASLAALGLVSAKTGHAPLPKSGEQTAGGHAVVAVGYDDAKQWFVVRNSWGSGWGMKGYFTLPYACVTDKNLASHFRTGRIVQ